MNKSMLVALILSSNFAFADAPAKVISAVAAMKKNAEHLDRAMKSRNLPRAVSAKSERVVRVAEVELKRRLLEGIAGDPTFAESPTGVELTVTGNKSTSTEATVHISSVIGTREAAAPYQYIQTTAETLQPGIRVDPRLGVLANRQTVQTFRTSGTPRQLTNNYNQPTGQTVVNGPGQDRAFNPLSPGLPFRGEKLEAGSHLVTTQSGPNMQMVFNANGTLSNFGGASRTRTYLLKANAEGKLTPVTLTPAEISDLQANTPFTSFKMNNEGTEVVPNLPKGYSEEELKEHGF